MNHAQLREILDCPPHMDPKCCPTSESGEEARDEIPRVCAVLQRCTMALTSILTVSRASKYLLLRV